MKERMKDVEQFEDFYAVTNDGRVYSKRKHRFLKPMKSSTGYYQFRLYWDKEHYKQVSLQLLVYQTFKKELHKNEYIYFVDGNRLNCRLNNLIALRYGK